LGMELKCIAIAGQGWNTRKEGKYFPAAPVPMKYPSRI
jgi:hypothetical protein